MIEDLLELDIPPGLYANGTKYEASSRWNDGNLVRFHEGTKQPVGGWVPRATSGAAISGSAHAALSWLKADGTPLFAIGTEDGLYIIDNSDAVFNITPTTGHASPYNWQLSLFGTFLIATNTLLGDDDISATNVFVWEGDTAVVAVAAFTIANGPQGVYSGFATPERFLVLLRGKDPTSAPPPIGVTQLYSERRVYFASQETIDTYIASDTNTAGNFDLATDGRLILGAAGRGQSLLWTDIDLWTMSYIGGDLIYSFGLAGSNCGIVSKRAAVVLNQGAYWMSRGKFFVYDGFVRALPCEVTDKVFGDFGESFAHTVWAFANSRFNEVTWFYPSAASSTPDRYVTYNYQEQHWSFGALRRSVGVSQRFRQDIIDAPVPVMFDDAQMFDHETGNERSALAFLTSGPKQLGAGDRLMRLQGIVPDDKTAGDVQLRLYTSMAPDAAETLRGPFSLSAYTPLRVTARQVRVRLEETGAASWRVGRVRLAVRAVERRGPGAAETIDTTPASILIVPSAVTLITAQSFTFSALVLNAEGQVLDLQPTAWISDNVADVPVDDTGTVTAVATPATAHITATLGALTSNIATVTVAGDTTPASITVTPTPTTVVAASTRQLTAVVKNAVGMILTRSIDSWTSDNTSKATVSSSGLVTGVAAGGCNIHAAITAPAITSNAAVLTVTDSLVIHQFTSADSLVVTSGSGPVTAMAVGKGGDGGTVGGTNGGGGGGGQVTEVARTVTPGTYPVAFTGGSGVTISLPTTVVANDGHAPAGGSRAGDAGSVGVGGGDSSVSDGTFSAFGNGGGGGAGGSGGNGSTGGSSPAFTGFGGDGGPGVASSITGTSIKYGGGGAGKGTTTSGNGTDGGGGVGQSGTRFGGGGGDQGGLGHAGVAYVSYLLSTGIVATGGTVTVIPLP